MEIDFGTIPTLIGLALVLFAIYALLYYKYIYSVIDPLFVFVFTTAFASVLAIQVIPDISDILHFFGCQLALWIGFVVVYRLSAQFDSTDSQESEYSFSDQALLCWTTYSLLIVYVLSNLIIGYVKGFALLSDEPTVSKIANFQQGFGLFRKINWSTGAFAVTGLIYLYLVRRRKIDLFLVGIVVFFSSLEGSKSALLQIAVSIGIVLYHPFFLKQRSILEKFKRFVPILIIGIMSIFLIVLLKENEGYEEVFFALVRRLLYSADSVLYYYQPVNIAHFESYSFSDYIAHITNPILGFFRLQPYIDAPGVVMLDNLRPPGSDSDIIVAPNAPFYIEGKIYFNFWLAFPYSFFVGYLYAKLRVHYFSITKSSAFYFVFMGSLLRLASVMIVDINLAVTQSFDLFFFVLLPYLILSFLLTHRLKIRLCSKFLKSFIRS